MRDDLYCPKCAPYLCNCYPTGPMEGDRWWDDASYARYQGDWPDPEGDAHDGFFWSLKFPQCYKRNNLPNMFPHNLVIEDDCPF